jgi:hypothetical protein
MARRGLAAHRRRYLTSTLSRDRVRSSTAFLVFLAAHANLTALSGAEVDRQICLDRNTLLSWGYPVSSFAYPFASLDASVKRIAQRCGYVTARAVGSLKSPRSCSHCPVTEDIPPADLYATRTPDDIDTSWSLADLRNTVTRAEAAGGWLAFNFHHVCDSCSPSSVRPAVFEQFVAWLKARSSTSGRTQVRTVQQVVTGAVKPAVAAIQAAPPGRLGVNALKNPTLEGASASSPNVPFCWTATSSGTKKAAYSRTRSAHSGSFASRIDMPSTADGDAKLVPTFDLGDCSPLVAADHVYELGAWYKSTTDVYFTVYQRNAIGQWTYWTQSSRLTAARDWTKATWITPAFPSDAAAASFGLTIDAPGTLIIDDLGFVDATPAAAMPPPLTSGAATTDATDSAAPADQSNAGTWFGIAGIIIAFLGVLAGLLHNYWRRSR